MIRIANGQGFWGDWLEAPVRLVEDGPLDYLTLDYLAEVTMSILQKQKKEDASLGYARDFPALMARLEHLIKEREVKVIANAGGVNVEACAKAVRRQAPSLKVAVVQGDNIIDRIGSLIDSGQEFINLDTGENISAIRGRILSANAYIGAFPIAEALNTGADVVITGRCADAALALGPMIHAYRWEADDWNKLAAGTIAGHIIECGPQCSGGNSQEDWQNLPDPANIGYPIVEMDPNGGFTITKHAETGGRVTVHTVKDQLLYEIGDPKQYLTPDVAADFTSIKVRQADPNRVRVTGAKGSARPPKLKVSISYHWGWKAAGTIVFPGPEACAKAHLADVTVRTRLQQLGLKFDKIHSETIGDDALVQLRMAARGQDRQSIDRFTREMIPLVLSGPPGATGYGEGRPPVREVVAYWPSLIDRNEITPRVEVFA